MVLTVKNAAPADYYFQVSGLEADPNWARGIWYCPSEQLGVKHKSEVAVDALALLLDRRRPDIFDRRDYLRNDSPAGRDFVFSAPKSASLLWAFGDQQTKRVVENAHNIAVERSVELFLSQAMFERCGKGGKTLRFADGAAALFTHVATRAAVHDDGSRFPDPNLHSHVVVPDLVINAERRLKVAYTAVWGRWIMALGAWYHACLAYQLRAAGFKLTARGGNGLFQVEGIDQNWVAAFSARTEGAKLRARLHRNEKVAKQAQEHDLLEMRSPQASFVAEALYKQWLTHKERHGVDVSGVERLANEAQAEGGDAATENVTDQTTAPSWTTILAGAVEETTEFLSVMQAPDLFRATAVHLATKYARIEPSWRELKAAIAKCAALIVLEETRSYGFKQWTSPGVVDCEQSIVELTSQLVARRSMAANVEPFLQSGSTKMNEDQAAAARLAASHAAIVVIEGAAGTGKTSLLGPVIDAYKARYAGIRIIGCAEAWRPALALKEQFGIECHALADLFARLRAGEGLNGRTILIVDEIGLTSSRRMRDLLVLAQVSGAKLILVGDEEQLDPISAGSGLRLIKRNDELKIASLKRLVRQDDERQRLAIQSLIDGDTRRFTELLSRDSRWHTTATYEDAYRLITERLARHYSQPILNTGALVAVARSNREVHDLSRRLRGRLREMGTLQGDDHGVHAVTPMQRSVRLFLARGDHIRFLTRQPDLQVFNGTRAVIESIDGDGGARPIRITAQVIEESINGRRLRRIAFSSEQLSDHDGRLLIGPAYASTIYGLQGATVDETIIFKTERLTYRELYVAATRARSRCEIVDVDRSLSQALASEDRSQFALEARNRYLGRAKRSKKAKPLAIDFQLRSDAGEDAR
jgi:conjugative relaxase-like TrwC/TraI family protein